jgi:uncharacterized damage-inducible protein DinB
LSLISIQPLIAELLHLVDAAEHRIHHCVRQLSDEQIWQRPHPEMNSIANQILHVCGNLKQWSVDGITGAPSDRDRDAEFAADHTGGKDVILDRLAQTLTQVRSVVSAVRSEELEQTRMIQGFEVTGLGALMHTIPHLVGHTHQIMQLTRWILGNDYEFDWTPDGDRSSVPL